MAELTAVLIVLGIFLAVVTIVGHGIWVLLAAVFRGLSKPTKSPPLGHSEERRACPRCFTPLGERYPRCIVCGWPGEVGKQTSTEAGVAAVREQLHRFTRLGVLDESTRNTLAAAIHEQESRLSRAKTIAAAAVPSEARAIPSEKPVEPAEVAPPSVPMHAPSTVAERAEKYAVSRAEAQSQAESESAATVPDLAASPATRAEPAKPAVPVSRLFAAFMEEKNIRWGELVGGLLIIGCSIALVISFWSEIATRPLLKFVLLGGVTAALFGVGLYTDRRWQIHTTSHGILIIATLLVPLNFLAIAAFTLASPPSDLLSLAGEAASLIVFSLLVYLAGRILVPDDALHLVVAVMLPSLAQLLVRRFAEPASPLAWLYVLAGLPVATYVATTTLVARKWWLQTQKAIAASSDLSGAVSAAPALPFETYALRVLTFLGLASAAMVLPLALLVHKVPTLEQTLHRLSPLVAIAGLPPLVFGLLFWIAATRLSGGWSRATVSPQSPAAGHLPAGLQTAGIAIGVVGALLMVVAIVVAWPEPAFLLPTALAVAVVMTAVALWFEISAAHVPAAVAFAAAWLVGFYLVRGDTQWTHDDPAAMRSLLLSATSGHALVPLAAVFGALAWWLSRIKRGSDGLIYGALTAATAAASLALVAWFGFGRVGDPHHATWTLAIYAVGALTAAIVLNRADVARIGSVLSLATLVQAVVYGFQPQWQLDQPWVVALLAHSSFMAIGCGLLSMTVSSKLREPSAIATARRLDVIQSLVWSAQITSLVAAVWLVVQAHAISATVLSIHLAWLAGVWMLLSVLAASRWWFTSSQIALVLAIACGVTSVVETQAWYVEARHPWIDPWFLAAQGVALACYCLIVGAVRGFMERMASYNAENVVESPAPRWLAMGDRMLNTPWPAVDHLLEIGLVLLVLAVATYSAVPGVAQELAPLEAARGNGAAVRIVPPIERFEIAGIAHGHAADQRAWILLGAVGGILAARLWQRGTERRRIGLVLVAFAVCPLLGARWEADVAVASALRWLSAGFFAIASIVIWTRAGWLRSRGWLESSSWRAPSAVHNKSDHSLLQETRNLLIALVLLVYVLMGAYVAQAALQRAGMPATSTSLWWYVLVWSVVAGAAALVISRLPPTHIDITGERRSWSLPTRDALLLLAVAPLAVLLTFAIARALDQHPVVGPNPESWFRHIGWDVSYGVPLVVIALVFIGYAVRDRSSAFAFSAGLLLNVVATIVVLLRLARGGGTLDATAWITVAQVNAIVAGVAALAWRAAIAAGRYRPERPGYFGDPPERPRKLGLLATQVVLAAALCATFLLPAVVRVAAEPQTFTWAASADGALGWWAAVLAAAAALWIRGRTVWTQASVAWIVAAIVALIALSAARRDTGNWLAFHSLVAGCCAAAWLLPVATRGLNQLLAARVAWRVPMVWSAPAARLFGLVAMILAVRGYGSDPASPWWTLAALAAIGARNLWIAWHESRPAMVWIAVVLLVPAANILWVDWADQFSPTTGFGTALEFLWINVVAAALLALASVWLGRVALLRNRVSLDAGPVSPGPAFHRFAAWAIVAVMLLTTGVGLLADLMGDAIAVSMPLAWSAWIAAAAVALACWWDPAVRWPVACLYCVGLIAVGIYLDGLNFGAPMFHWALALALAAYSLATSALWSGRDRLSVIASRLLVPLASRSGHGWMVSANFLLGVGALVLVAWIETTLPEFTRRMAAAYAIGAQAFALGLLARGAVRTPLQYLALVWGVLFAISFGWAWLPHDFAAPWLHRLVISVVALAVMVVVYGFGLVKFLRRENELTLAAARLVPPLATIAVTLIGLVLAVEVNAFINTGAVPIVTPALVAVGLALVGLAAAALVAALVSGRDPLGLSERGRTLYVYAAEALAALLFLHIRVTMPWLFRGWFLRFWPLIVMGIAFVGVGLAELFDRRRQRVLSEPLRNTGVLLPLLPAIGFFIVSSEVHYSLLLLSIAVLYAAMSVLRQSFLYGVMAAVAANGSLWFYLHERENLSFFDHPQFWLIPPALCALVAGYINRDRLNAQQSAALRYASAIVIYVSSTADIFINGVAEAPWLPAVLAGLSILGVMVGIALRVRAFLYLGTAFLVVAILTVIWHAASQQTWIWWVAGIVAGALIIALFGLFEKRRDDVLRMVEELRQWEA